ncbi:MAG: hypothetical protein EOM15_14645 [Spirochaetia bacterium]|nr:hypothetical protein [Spirochaetia bacterium]
MKRLALLLSVLLCSAQVYTASLVVDIQGSVPISVEEAVSRALERSMLVRMSEEQTLYATLVNSIEDVAYHLHLRVEERELSFNISKELKNLEKFLVSSLAYDGLVLLEPPDLLSVGFFAPTGYGMYLQGEKVQENTIYKVLDGRNFVRGRVVVSNVSADKSIGFLTQFEGKELGLGMVLQKEKSDQFGLSVSFDALYEPFFCLEYAKNLPVHPFSFSLGLGTLGYDTLELSVLLGAKLPLSALFGSSRHLGRNISLGSSVSLSLGYRFSESQLYGRGRGSVSVIYHIQDFSFSLSVGNQVSVTGDRILSRGLFLSLLTAYTYSL